MRRFARASVLSSNLVGRLAQASCVRHSLSVATGAAPSPLPARFAISAVSLQISCCMATVFVLFFCRSRKSRDVVS